MAEQPQQPPPPADRPPAERRAAAIAAVLGAAAVASAGAAATAGGVVLTAAVLAALTKLLVRWKYDRRVIRYALRVTTRLVRTPLPGAQALRPGPAERANAEAERVFLGWFLERTTARVETAYAAGAEDGVPEAREDRYIEQHLDAQERRRAAARRVDQEAAKPGQIVDRPAGTGPRNTDGGTPGDPDGILETRGRVILRWRAHPDDRVTPECRAADGAWFYADTPPIIGYPGMPHGGTCRCWPAHAGSLAEVARGRTVDEAVRAIISSDTDHRPHPTSGDREERQIA